VEGVIEKITSYFKIHKSIAELTADFA
jgi:hypothetical protein